MKKMFSLALIFGLFTANTFAINENGGLVSIDSLALMQKSKEGQVLAKRLQGEIEKFQEEVKTAQQKVVELQDQITKQSKVLSKDALMEKGEELTKVKKRAERDLADKEDSLKLMVQKEQMLLRERQLKVAKKVFDEKGYDMMVDRNTPGVLFVKNAIDKTDEILSVINAEYEKETAKQIINKTTGKATKAV